MTGTDLTHLVGRLKQTCTGMLHGEEADARLLARFCEQRDPAAFEVIIRRHGRLVLTACRRVLSDSADVDDAFQATFLLLLKKPSSVHKPSSLGSWLYGVAHRVAVRLRDTSARRQHLLKQSARPDRAVVRDDISWHEACSILHDELDQLPEKYRMPLLLCYLEGLSRDQAAHQLGRSLAAVKADLARGRERLRLRLTKRGIALSAGLFAIMTENSTHAGPTPALIETTLRLTAGDISPSVAALVKGVFPMMLAGKKSIATVVLSIALLSVAIGFGRGGEEQQQPAAPVPQVASALQPAAKPPEVPNEPGGRSVSGRVVDPDGKVIKDAVVGVATWRTDDSHHVVEVGRTGGDGTFRGNIPLYPAHREDYRMIVARAPGFAADWMPVRDARSGKDVEFRLAKATVPIRGRVLNLEGKPISGATVRFMRVAAPDGRKTLADVYRRWPGDPGRAAGLLGKSLFSAKAARLPERVVTDADGRFEITGVGDGRLCTLEISHEKIATVVVKVAVDPGFDAKAVRPTPPSDPIRRIYFQPGPPLYGPTFDHAANPARIVTGVVRDLKTKKPLADVVVTGRAEGAWWENHTSARTDGEGKYRLLGLPNAPCDLTFAKRGEDHAYLVRRKAVKPTEGLTPATVDMEMAQGVVLTGRVTDGPTGKPIVGSVHYSPLVGNKEVFDLPGEDFHLNAWVTYSLKEGGRFRIIAPPGLGVITVRVSEQAANVKTYPEVRIRKEDLGKPYFKRDDGLGDVYITAGRAFMPLLLEHDYRVIEPKPGTGKLTVNFKLTPGQAVPGKVVGPDGKPFHGAAVAGTLPTFDEAVAVAGDAFEVHGLDPAEERTLAAIHLEKKLAAITTVTAPAKDPAFLRLAPWGAVEGRVVDEDGKPVAGVAVRTYFESDPARTLYTEAEEERRPTTGPDGRFRCDVPFSDTAFRLMFSIKEKYLQPGREMPNRKVSAGKTLSLGDIVIKVED